MCVCVYVFIYNGPKINIYMYTYNKLTSFIIMVIYT